MGIFFEKECKKVLPKSRNEIVNVFYDQADEDGRLHRSRHGQLEYLITMSFIHRFAKSGSKVLEVGAGTGKYSIALAREGMNVSAIELVDNNLAILKRMPKVWKICSHIKVMLLT